MRLHVTLTSPYARMTRVALIEHKLQSQVAVVEARTREINSPYYAISPSGRVPFLETGDGLALEESEVICAYFDAIGSGPALVLPLATERWRYAELYTRAHSYLDGIAVWGRELRRPPCDRSQTVIDHEEARAARLARWWQGAIGHPLMNGNLNTAQMALYCAFDAVGIYIGEDATASYPALAAWRARLAEQPSFAATTPPLR